MDYQVRCTTLESKPRTIKSRGSAKLTPHFEQPRALRDLAAALKSPSELLLRNWPAA